jgi:hypothetical protein
MIWDLRRSQIERAAKTPKTGRLETELRDLDYWASDDMPDDDGDDDTCDDDGDDDCDDEKAQTMKICPRCGGTGKVRDDDNEDDETEDE